MTVAIAYLMQKAQYVFPMIGGRKVEHLHANIEALEIALAPEHVKEIEDVNPFDVGFPTNFIVRISSSPLLLHSELTDILRVVMMIKMTSSCLLPAATLIAGRAPKLSVPRRRRSVPDRPFSDLSRFSCCMLWYSIAVLLRA